MNEVDKNSDTLLIISCKNNNKNMIDLLLMYNADINYRGHQNFTALHHAYYLKNMNLFFFLL